MGGRVFGVAIAIVLLGFAIRPGGLTWRPDELERPLPGRSIVAQSTTVGIVVDPASKTAAVGEVFDLNIRVDAGTQPVDSVDAFIDFNRAILKVVDANGNEASSIVAGSNLKAVLMNKADNSLGRIDYAAGLRPGAGDRAVSGTFVLAAIRFKAIAQGDSPITFSITSPRQTDAYCTSEPRPTCDDQNPSVLGSASDGVVTIAGVVTPSPTGTPGVSPTATLTAPVAPPSGGGGGGTTPPTATPTVMPTPTQTPTPVATPTPTQVSQTINVSDGGAVSHGGGTDSPGGVVVQVPAQAVSGQAAITLTIAYASSPPGAPPQGTQVGTTIELTLRGAQGEPITVPARPLTITFRPKARDLETGGGDINKLVLGRWDGQKWEMLETTRQGAAGTIRASIGHLTKFSVLAVLPTPTITGPSEGALVGDMAPLLSWTNPAGTTQYHIQVIPYNNDGPGIDLIRNVETSYQVQAPRLGIGNYVMLPGLTYTWQVRTTSEAAALGKDDSGWSGWVSRTFRTFLPTSSTISAVSPSEAALVDGLTPTLKWANTNPQIFYYEVQVSKDRSFNTDPQTATASVLWELRHGGETAPMNSYAVRAEFALEPNTTYYWRVRPRVQGDAPSEGVAWSNTWSFRTR